VSKTRISALRKEGAPLNTQSSMISPKQTKVEEKIKGQQRILFVTTSLN
jgi:hypothetical protein